ncbi:MAG: cache domain-containing protein [Thermodesulfobacteriota bacterium]
MFGKRLWLLPLAVLFCLACLHCPAPAAAAGSAAQDKEVKALVKKAVKLVKAKGQAAFAEINAPGGPWRRGDTAIFVTDAKGLEVANAAYPELVGKNLWGHKDPDGRLVVQEQWKLVKAKGKGWYECKWPKPGSDQAVACRVYLEGVKVNGRRHLVGAGYFPQ